VTHSARAAGVAVAILAAVAVGRWWQAPWWLVVLAGLVLAGVASAAVALIDTRRLKSAAGRVAAWLGEGDRVPVDPRGPRGWQELAVAVNALGAAYEQQATRIAVEAPWRWQLVDALVQPALLFSSGGRLLAANDPARELLGIPLDASEITVVQAVGSAALADAVREVRSGQPSLSLDLEHRDHDLRADITRVGEEILLVVTDRTPERRVEELRRNFVVNASHELKTPVASVQTLAEALEVTMRADPARAADLLPRLSGEAQRLARLVHDLLDLRRLEERGPVARAPIDLAELTRQVVADLVPRAEDRDVELAVDAPDRAMIIGMPDDLETIVKNLVGNAIEYNVAGGTVVVRIDTRHGSQELRVIDTGIGIPQHELGRIFERFYRVDPARSRETGGTGLGLSIVRHAVEKHGGTITVDSLLGDGTTFTVTLPIEPPR
jgi:two-component system, OmpR family, sensor histidine kinase SenX3